MIESIKNGNFTDKEKEILIEYCNILLKEGYYLNEFDALEFSSGNGVEKLFIIFYNEGVIKHFFRKIIYGRIANLSVTLKRFDNSYIFSNGQDLQNYILKGIQNRELDELDYHCFNEISNEILLEIENKGFITSEYEPNDINKISESILKNGDIEYKFQFNYTSRTIKFDRSNVNGFNSLTLNELKDMNAADAIKKLIG